MSGNPKTANSTIIVDEAKPDEKEAVVAITLAAYVEYKENSPPGFWDIYTQNIKNAILNDPAITLLVAREGNEIVGSTCYCVPRDAGNFKNDFPEMRLLAVPPTSRNKGIANLLIEACEERASAGGVLTLHTTKLMTTAKDMYERRGYVRYPELDFEPVPGFTVWGYKKLLSKPARATTC